MKQPLSYVHPGAKIAKNVVIEPFTSIDADVAIGEGSWIGSNVSIMDGARIGKNCNIFPGAVISAVPQDLKYNNEKTYVEIGDKVTVRECTTINIGTNDRNKTVVGNNCLIMAYSHIAHDCIVGDNCIFSNSTTLAGHVTIGDSVIIGGNSAVQQFTRIGRLAMIGGMTGVLKDVIPFGLSFGNRNYLKGLNLIGLRRNKYKNKDIMELDKAYKKIFSSKNLHEN